MKENEKLEQLSKENNNEKRGGKRSKKNGKIIFLPFLLIIVILIGVFVFPNKKGSIKIKVKSTLESLVEKSNLETVNITYNVIAKECKNENNCDKSSNKIRDFKYVVSCQGTITAGIDFNEVDIEVDEENKKVLVTIPDATIKGDPNIGSINFLNGDELGADELPNAMKLCQTTVKEKSEADVKLIPAAKEQARLVLEEFYKQWIKAYDSSYVVEVK